mmetsp:Transcript_92818/g.246576  ORF Transcript_92818/g.246576 Transcript_92818/m.246576 type:complete len:302 (-) Transcript_92818:21-926(-)
MALEPVPDQGQRHEDVDGAEEEPKDDAPQQQLRQEDWDHGDGAVGVQGQVAGELVDRPELLQVGVGVDNQQVLGAGQECRQAADALLFEVRVRLMDARLVEEDGGRRSQVGSSLVPQEERDEERRRAAEVARHALPVAPLLPREVHRGEHIAQRERRRQCARDDARHDGRDEVEVQRKRQELPEALRRPVVRYEVVDGPDALRVLVGIRRAAVVGKNLPESMQHSRGLSASQQARVTEGDALARPRAQTAVPMQGIAGASPCAGLGDVRRACGDTLRVLSHPRAAEGLLSQSAMKQTASCS